jgi:MYXO-CTERM domain-containing protein
MMSFGWRPQSSCYKGIDTVGTCPSVGWFWGLVALAGLAGLATRKR